MHAFKEFLDALDCPGAHILISVILGLIGVGVAMRGHEMAASSLLGFLVVAAAAMKSNAKANGKSE